MKKLTLFLITTLLLLYAINTNSQIKISDKSEVPKIKPIPYDGSFMKLDYVSDKAKKRGLIGEKITLLEIWNLKSIDGKDADYSDRKKYQNKTFEIVDYKYELGDVLKIKRDSIEFLFKPSSMDEYVFNKYIEINTNKLLDKVFIPLKLNSKVKTMDGKDLTIEGSKSYRITRVEFSKLSLKYSLVVTLNENIEMIYPNGIFSGYNNRTDKRGWITLQSSDLFQTKITLIEKDEFKKFTKSNSKYLNEIRKSQVKLGMTKEQCDYSWGSATKVLENVSGYQVRIFGKPGNSQSLYFKDGILKIIK